MVENDPFSFDDDVPASSGAAQNGSATQAAASARAAQAPAQGAHPTPAPAAGTPATMRSHTQLQQQQQQQQQQVHAQAPPAAAAQQAPPLAAAQQRPAAPAPAPQATAQQPAQTQSQQPAQTQYQQPVQNQSQQPAQTQYQQPAQTQSQQPAQTHAQQTHAQQAAVLSAVRAQQMQAAQAAQAATQQANAAASQGGLARAAVVPSQELSAAAQQAALAARQEQLARQEQQKKTNELMVSEVLKRVAAENATVQSMLPRYGPVVNFTTFQQEYMRSPEAEVIGALVHKHYTAVTNELTLRMRHQQQLQQQQAAAAASQAKQPAQGAGLQPDAAMLQYLQQQKLWQAAQAQLQAQRTGPGYAQQGAVPARPASGAAGYAYQGQAGYAGMPVVQGGYGSTGTGGVVGVQGVPPPGGGTAAMQPYGTNGKPIKQPKKPKKVKDPSQVPKGKAALKRKADELQAAAASVPHISAGVPPPPGSTAAAIAAAAAAAAAKPRKKARPADPDSDDNNALVDIDDEEQALMSQLQQMAKRNAHRPVLEGGAVLNDIPLRTRMLTYAAQHGVRLVHPNCVKACSLAVELYVMRLVQDMVRFSHIRTGSAKDAPGLERDLSRNWRKDVLSLEETEKESAKLQRQAQQEADHQMLLAQGASRRHMDKETKEQIREAKEKREVQMTQKGVAATLKSLLNIRQLGHGKRNGPGSKLRSGQSSHLGALRKSGGARLAPQPLPPGIDSLPAGSAAGPATPGGTPGRTPGGTPGVADTSGAAAMDATGAGASAQQPAAMHGAGTSFQGAAAGAGGMSAQPAAAPPQPVRALALPVPDLPTARVLRLDDLIAALQHHPNYTHSALLYKLMQDAHSGPL